MYEIFDLRKCVSNRSSFVITSVILFGTLAAVIGVFAFDEYGPERYFFVIPGSYLAGYIWGILMWTLRFRDLSSKSRRKRK